MKTRWLQIGLWLVIPLGVLAAAEGAFRLRYPFPPHYWKPVADAARRGRIDSLFLGNSQVACAIDADVFAREMTTDTKPVVVNAGMGWTTPFQHYLGLCRLVRE